MPAEAASRLEPGQRRLQLILLVDADGGLKADREPAVNFGIESMLRRLAEWQQAQGRVEIMVRAIAFSTEARWHIAEPTAVSELRWPRLDRDLGGRLNWAPAFDLVTAALAAESTEPPALPAALVLITSGLPTDHPNSFRRAVAGLLASPVGGRSFRVAVAAARVGANPATDEFLAGSPQLLVAGTLDEILDRLGEVAEIIGRAYGPLGAFADDLPEPGSTRLRPGDTVRTWPAGEPVPIGRRIDDSGRFTVYAAEHGGRPAAVRWYLAGPPAGPDVADLASLVELGNGLDRAFSWPYAVVTSPGLPAAGLVGPLVGPRFLRLTELLSRPDTPDFRELAAIGSSLVTAFRSLHQRGLCHRDLHLGKVLADPASGEVVVLGFDDVGPSGAPALYRPAEPWAAPELVRDGAWPSVLADLHTLAVFLFYLFCYGHPFDGVAVDTWGSAETEEELLKRHLGRPVFVFDPADDSNRPAPDSPISMWWPLYPPFFRALFAATFTAGLADPGSRVTESTWLAALQRLADSQWDCPACRAVLLWHEENPDQPCWHCGGALPLPPLLVVGTCRLVLAPGAVISWRHLGLPAGRRGQAEQASQVAQCEEHPADPGQVVLRNLTSEPWIVRENDAEPVEVPPGRRLRVRPMTIEIAGQFVMVSCG